ncbi:hypothetical protein GCM10023331_18530 [Algivirga pacifica]|uniref:Calx-beta domain-containing protein n=2 Tax=Algivirga pacifica TaxID=1162670 RepID=A0ABP9DCL4_9BACT
MVGLAACEEHQDAIYTGPISVSLVEGGSIELSESPEEQNVSIEVRLTAGEAVQEDITVAYSIEGEGWQNRVQDLSGGSVTIPAGEYLATINLKVLDNSDQDGDQEFALNLTEVTNGNAIIGLGGSESFKTMGLMVLDDEFNPCGDVGAAFFGKDVVLEYRDGAYDGDNDGTVGKPSDAACDGLRIVGDALNWVSGAFDIQIDETSGSVSVPKQIYLSDGDDYWIEGTGTYNLTEGTITLDVYYLDYTGGTDEAEVDLAADGYAGTITVRLK